MLLTGVIIGQGIQFDVFIAGSIFVVTENVADHHPMNGTRPSSRPGCEAQRFSAAR